MEASIDTTPATELAFDRLEEAIASDLAGSERYPSGTVFIPTDAGDWRGAFLRNLREGRPIVLILPDGDERFIAPPDFWAAVGSFISRITGRRRPTAAAFAPSPGRH